MKNKTYLLLIVLFLFILLSAIGITVEPWEFDPRITTWYAVEEWELDFCSKWGGTEEAESGATSSTTIYLSQTTLSLQGRKQTYDVGGFEQTLYTASWYFEPLSEIDYTIELISTTGSFNLADGTASYDSPAIGHHEEYYDEDYTHVKMTYGNEWIKVPIMELK